MQRSSTLRRVALAASIGLATAVGAAMPDVVDARAGRAPKADRLAFACGDCSDGIGRLIERTDAAGVTTLERGAAMPRWVDVAKR